MKVQFMLFEDIQLCLIYLGMFPLIELTDCNNQWKNKDGDWLHLTAHSGKLINKTVHERISITSLRVMFYTIYCSNIFHRYTGSQTGNSQTETPDMCGYHTQPQPPVLFFLLCVGRNAFLWFFFYFRTIPALTVKLSSDPQNNPILIKLVVSIILVPINLFDPTSKKGPPVFGPNKYKRRHMCHTCEDAQHCSHNRVRTLQRCPHF